MTERTASGALLSLNAFALMAAQGVAFVFSFALPLILVRYMSVTEYGLFKQAFLLISATATLLPLGFSMSAYYFLPRAFGQRQGSVVCNILCFHFALGIVAAGALLIWPSIPELVFGSPELSPYAPLMAAVIVVWTISRVSEVIALAHDEFAFGVFFVIFAQTTRTVLLVLAVLAFGTLQSLLVAAIVQGILQNLALGAYLHSRFPGCWRGLDWPLMRQQISYVLPLGLAAVAQGFLVDLPGYFVSHRFGPADYAIYSVGLFAIPLANMCADAVNTTVLRRVSELQHQGRTRDIALLIANATRTLAALMLPLAVLLAVLGKELLAALFTERYLASYSVFVISLALVPFRAMITDPVIRSFSEHRFFPLKARVVTLVLLFLALWLVPISAGLVGIIATVATFAILERFVEIAKVWRILGLTSKDLLLFAKVGRIGLAVIVAGGAAAAAKFALGGQIGDVATIIVASAVFGSVYLASILLLDILSEGEKALLRRSLGILQRGRPLFGTPRE